jgi:hypothetical protein
LCVGWEIGRIQQRFQVNSAGGRMVNVKTLSRIAAIVVLLLGGLSAATAATNVVAQFLNHADRQYETSEQRTEIIHALEDMLGKPPAALRTQRYADYQGNKNAWPITTLLERYFVPVKPPKGWSVDAFYRDVPKPEARHAIREQLLAIKKQAN